MERGRENAPEKGKSGVWLNLQMGLLLFFIPLHGNWRDLHKQLFLSCCDPAPCKAFEHALSSHAVLWKLKDPALYGELCTWKLSYGTAEEVKSSAYDMKLFLVYFDGEKAKEGTLPHRSSIIPPNLLVPVPPPVSWWHEAHGMGVQHWCRLGSPSMGHSHLLRSWAGFLFPCLVSSFTQRLMWLYVILQAFRQWKRKAVQEMIKSCICYS